MLSTLSRCGASVLMGWRDGKCVRELRHKPKHFEATRLAPTHDASPTVVGSDALIKPQLYNALWPASPSLRPTKSLLQIGIPVPMKRSRIWCTYLCYCSFADVPTSSKTRW